jgi:predicted small secreted protein
MKPNNSLKDFKNLESKVILFWYLKKKEKKKARIEGSFATFTPNIFQKTKWNKLQHFVLGPKFRHLATDYSFWEI